MSVCNDHYDCEACYDACEEAVAKARAKALVDAAVQFHRIKSVDREAAEHKGWCDALRNVLASIEGYPNAGGDISIMSALERRFVLKERE